MTNPAFFGPIQERENISRAIVPTVSSVQEHDSGIKIPHQAMRSQHSNALRSRNDAIKAVTSINKLIEACAQAI